MQRVHLWLTQPAPGNRHQVQNAVPKLWAHAIAACTQTHPTMHTECIKALRCCTSGIGHPALHESSQSSSHSVTLSVHFHSLFAFSRSNMMSSSVTRSAPVAQRSVAARAVKPAAHDKVMAAARGAFVTASAAAMLCAWNPAPAEAIVKSPTQKGAERVQGFQLQNARLQKAFEVQQKSSPAVTAQVPVCSCDRPHGFPHPLKQSAE